MSGSTDPRERYWQGDTARLRARFFSEDGSPMAATGVRFIARAPDGTQRTPPTGTTGEAHVFVADLVVDVPGTWAWRADCTGPTAAVWEDELEVTRSLVL